MFFFSKTNTIKEMKLMLCNHVHNISCFIKFCFLKLVVMWFNYYDSFKFPWEKWKLVFASL